MLDLKLTQFCLTIRNKIAEQMAAIQKSIESIIVSNRDQSDQRRSRSRFRTRSRSHSHAPNGICWYHWKFGSDARRCKLPCFWKQKRDGPSLSAASDSGLLTRCLFVIDRNTKISFLVDTAADPCEYSRKLIRDVNQITNFQQLMEQLSKHVARNC